MEFNSASLICFLTFSFFDLKWNIDFIRDERRSLVSQLQEMKRLNWSKFNSNIQSHTYLAKMWIILEIGRQKDESLRLPHFSALHVLCIWLKNWWSFSPLSPCPFNRAVPSISVYISVLSISASGNDSVTQDSRDVSVFILYSVPSSSLLLSLYRDFSPLSTLLFLSCT